MTFSEQLIYLIDEFAKRIGIIIDWTSSNVMPYIQDLVGRYITYELVIASIITGLCVIGVIVAVCCALGAFNADCDGTFFTCTLVTIFSGVLSVVGLFTYIPIIFRLLFIPEFHIYEKLILLMQ